MCSRSMGQDFNRIYSLPVPQITLDALNRIADALEAMLDRQISEYGEPLHFCGTCKRELQKVRPGKYKCNYCEEKETV